MNISCLQSAVATVTFSALCSEVSVLAQSGGLKLYGRVYCIIN